MLTVVVVAVAAAAAPAQALVPEAFLATPRYEDNPAAAPGYFAYAQNSKARPNRLDVWVKPAGARRFKANPAGTAASLFGGAIDGTTLVYEQYARKSRNGDLKLLNLVTRKRRGPPAGINTGKHESGASLSGDWLLFRRTTWSTSTERIILHNVVTHEERALDATTGVRYAQPGNVAGNYAVWLKCRRWTLCHVYVHDIAAETTTRLDNPLGRAQYAPSVTEDGTVFLFEAANILCENVRPRIFRYLPGEARDQLALLPRNRDAATTSALVHGDESTTLYFDWYHCRTGAADIYKLEVPAPTASS